MSATPQPEGRPRQFWALGLLLAASLALQGCAALTGAVAVAGFANGVRVVADPTYAPLPSEETNRATLAYPVAQVFSVLSTTVARNGRAVVESVPATYLLRVSYPFSLLSNNWGGVIVVQCIEQGAAATTVVVQGSGRDTSLRIQKIGHEIFEDLKQALKAAPIEL